MKRLEIALLGHSLALNELAMELEQHGHCVYRLTAEQNLDHCLFSEGCLLIEDQSLILTLAQETAFTAQARLSLRVGVGPLKKEGLPQLELLCWFGTAKAQRLISRIPLTADCSGNGRMLRDSAIATLVDTVAVDIGRLARDGGYFLRAPLAGASHLAEQHGLKMLEQLAFDHHFNRTDQLHLLALAEIPLVERLDQSFLRFAERTALDIAGRKIKYGTLHAHSLAIQQRLLALLSKRMLAPDESPPVVGICLPKSPALFAGILAILGSGAVYLPLDPCQPLQRQRYILENAGAILLLHDGHCALSDQWPGLDISQLGADDTDPTRSLMRQRPASNAPCMALYTSGTTGHPKGVLLSQRNLSHFTAWYAEHVSLSEDSRVLQFSTLSFDSSVIDIFPTLLSGAELVVPSEDQRRDPLLLINLIKQGISHAFLPPALLSILPLDQPLGLEHLMTGGDVCEPYVIERLAGQCRFYNLYGPTEATVLITSRLFEPGSSNRNLGQPIANSQIYILDEQLQPVPENTPGELFIAGPGVCLGYLNNPTLTEDRYPTLGMPDGRNVRVYRTGDIGRWTAEGIELCGRRDNQVKIRGFRVEPEEIEHCLRASQLYRQIAVVIDAQQRILAFVAQPQGEAEPSRQSLRTHVEQQLPDYMRPTTYTELMNMPFASNGKVDRKALLELPVSFVDGLARRLPQTLVERQLLDLWADLLEMPAGDISTDESFFTLGGHSILLSQMLLDIREQFGRSVSINRFIEAPTLLTLAALIDNDGTQSSSYTVSPRALRDANPDLELTSVPVSQLGDVHKVVVTGANGFLGVHIVEALLAWGASEIVCLVRESGGLDAQERFAQALRENRLDHLDFSRVTVYPADITQPLLGLSPEVYERIDCDFGVLVHSAANVNHVQNYEALIKDNVEPIFECLRLCEGRSKKIFNFISTLSASSAVDTVGNVLEQAAASTPPIYIKNGYNLSKWVAERILQSARDQGAWVNIYRPGNIAFNSVTGVCQPHKNRLMLMLKGSIQLGQVPEFAMNFDLMPVDFLARFIGFQAGRYQPNHAIFNLHNPEPLSWSRYVAAFRAAGRDFQMVGVAQWQQQLRRVDSQNALFGVLGFYLGGFEEDIGDISTIKYENAQAGIQEMGERYPLKTDALLRKGCDYLKEIDFI
ncbi:non-ribosomal peptide synthetase [Pseudomonas sp. 10B1]|uniref:non-ribosomal peptide synthetase n=2 Tax=Pseudomonas TaxID=286 RepID=UPI002B227CBB|nr:MULTISPECIES: non-ribosomal peptide synthetase [unclassified Pseudomonas]MEA9996826.1 non-ribosomal peptide synthetase [Pseudomonas sp. AA4]MEB0126497.1 non-ribosomal peptide synthetase [Pseudomonas sp. CCC1.2]MEB0155844.1 non-ribosomal peptide synthetase [Pseudomonas sp. CCC4.3]MEB0221462.1 non-ribosomal peptide synthetase [Pseudomonas sp. AB12(2023)]MEB0309711.1 non-ribosomal peptide synthetase [Pseudomonas sp. 10B1]